MFPIICDKSAVYITDSVRPVQQNSGHLVCIINNIRKKNSFL